MQIAYKQVLLMLIERDKNEGNHLTNPEPGDTIYCVFRFIFLLRNTICWEGIKWHKY